MVEWVNSHRRASWIIGAVVVVFVIGAIGSAGENEQAAPKPSSKSSSASPSIPNSEEESPKREKPDAADDADPAEEYREAVASCAESVGYSTRDAGNALRIESSTGQHMKANVQVFQSEREAARFAAQLEVPGAAGGNGVAIWLADAEDADMSVIRDCLTP